jgi:cell division protein ZapB
MSNRLLEQLEKRIDDIIETIDLLRLQVEELEEKNVLLHNENHALKSRQSQWEQGLNTLLNKLDDVSTDSDKILARAAEYQREEIEALV